MKTSNELQWLRFVHRDCVGGSIEERENHPLISTVELPQLAFGVNFVAPLLQTVVDFCCDLSLSIVLAGTS